MSFLWFMLALIFFGLWRSAKSSSERTNKENYDAGQIEGKQALVKTLRHELKKGPLSHHAFEQLVKEPKAQVEVQTATTSSQSALSATGITGLMQDIDETSEEEEVIRPIVQVATVAQQVHTPKRSKAEQTNQNLNTLLYAASFLIIAAAAAFIATNTPAIVRLSGLWAVIVGFYVIGLVLHAKVPYLKPAATAFVGTGLALIPFAGIALSQLGGLSGGWSWCITSIIGIVSYAIATIRLSSNIVGYLTIAFSLSFAASTVAVISGPVVLYFVVLILVSLLFHLASHLKLAWLPNFFRRPIEETGHLLTPITLLGSLFAYDTMTIASYQIVLWVATAYYGVLWVTNRTYIYEFAIRVLITIAVLVSVLDIVKFDAELSVWIWLAVLVAQMAYSFISTSIRKSKVRFAEIVWYWVLMILFLLSLPLWVGIESVRAGLITHVAVIGILSIVMAWRLRLVVAAVPALFVSVALPFLVGRWPGDILVSEQGLTAIFIGISSLALGAFKYFENKSDSVLDLLRAGFLLHFVTAVVVSLTQASTLAIGLSTLALTILIFIASYIYRQLALEIVAVFFAAIAIYLLVDSSGVHSEWVLVVTIGMTGLLYVATGLFHDLVNEIRRRNILVAAALILGAGLIFTTFSASDSVQIVSAIFAMVIALVSFAARTLVHASFLRQAMSAGYSIYPVAALLIAAGLEAGWYALIFAITTGIYWAASYAERTPAFMAFGNVALVGFITSAWLWLGLDTSWFMFGVAWVVATIFYASYLVYSFKIKDSSRWTIQLISTWVALIIPTFVHIWSSGQHGYAAASTLAIIGVTVITHGIVVSRPSFIEAGVYIGTFALQRLVGLSSSEFNMVFYGHWWALTVASVAVWRRNDPNFMMRLIIATGLITFTTGLMALSSGGTYQVLFLIEHVALLIAGALSRTSWALWWGLVATVLAVLYFLRSSLFLSFLFLGLTLLGIVVWRLVKAHRKN